MKVICRPTFPSGYSFNPDELYFKMFGLSPRSGIGDVGNNFHWFCRKSKVFPDEQAWDLLSIALGVIAADSFVLRRESPDGWTRQIELEVAVNSPAYWAEHSGKLNDLLSFLSGDIWKVTFLSEGAEAPKEKSLSSPEDTVCLLSGGMDSFIGAVDLTAAGRKIITASQISKDSKSDQAAFSRLLGCDRLFQANHNVRRTGYIKEDSQRARSFLFLVYGIMVASTLDSYKRGETVDVYMPENGYISINVPLTPLRIGSLSTRTTHPIFIHKLQDFLIDVGINARIVNPYQFYTKGEMLQNCTDQSLLISNVFKTMSCGKHARQNQQCGRCVPCIIRRSAIHAWGKQDCTNKGYKFNDIWRAGNDYKSYDDVLSFVSAISTVKNAGLEKWIGSSANVSAFDSRAPYVEVVRRGLEEVETYFRHVGVI